MWVCPVCQQSCQTPVCSGCGFDNTQYYERFPTLALLGAGREALSSRRTSYAQALNLPGCPVCGAHGDSLLCAKCGFDASSNYEQYLTLKRLPIGTPAISRRKQELSLAALNTLRCPVCGCTSFTMRFAISPHDLICTGCGTNLKESQIQEQRTQYHASRMKSLGTPQNFIAAGDGHGVILHLDGTVEVKGNYLSGQNKTADWKNIVSVAAGTNHTVGLHADGTVVAVGSNDCKQCDVSNWTNIVAIAAGPTHTVGLRSNGTVVATGSNGDRQCNVGHFTDIIALAPGNVFTAVLRKDGTVHCTGEGTNRHRELSKLKDITALSASWGRILGLRSDGTVLTLNNSTNERIQLGHWRDIVAVAAGKRASYGLKRNGTLVSTTSDTYILSKIQTWKNVIAIAAGENFVMALCKDGTVVNTGFLGETPISIL